MTERGSYGSMTDHPDLLEMRERYERASLTPPAVITEGFLLIAGLWLAISPWVIGFNTVQPHVMINDLILGIGIAVVALGLAIAPQRMLRMSWSVALIGVWVIISQWVIERSASSAGIVANNVATGTVVLLLGLTAAGITVGATRGQVVRR